MKRFIGHFVLTALLATTASADVISFGLNRALANGLYCQLNGCTFTGPLTGTSNIVEFRNGVSPQVIRVYNTFTDASNYERGVMDWAASANVLTIGAKAAGTGTQRAIAFDAASYNFATGGSNKYTMLGTVFEPVTTNAADLGDTTHFWRTLFLATSLQGSLTKTLPETTATGFVSITVANSAGCAGKAVYTIYAADATNTQLVSGELFFSAAATNAGVVTAAAVSDQHALNPVTSGTLTNTMTSTTAANAITLLANATSSLTQTTLEIRYRIEMQGGTCTVTGL